MVLVNSFTVLEVQGCVGVHAGCLDEGLVLVAGMGRCALNANYTLNRLLTQDWVAETVCNMWKFLIISPFDFVFVSAIVVVMGSAGPVLQMLLIVDFLSLTEPFTCGLSHSMVEVEEAVVKMLVGLEESWVFLVEPRGDVAFFVQAFRSDLSNVHVYKESVVAIDLKKFVLGQVFGIDVVLDVNVLVRQDVLGLVVLVAGSSHVVNLDVLALLVFINVKIKVAVGKHFCCSGGNQGFSVDFFFELMESKFLGDDIVDFVFDFFYNLVVGWTRLELFKETGFVAALFEVSKVVGFSISLCSTFSYFIFRELPECLYLVLGRSCSGGVGRKSGAEHTGLFQHAKRLSL